MARAATHRVLPAMKTCRYAVAAAIASRDFAKARDAAEQFSIPRAYGSYEELLADSSIDAVYIPLPNHLHVPWSIRAAEHAKHVLCEKPAGISSAEVSELIRVRDRTGVKIGEAFMIRAHPRWIRVRELVESGRIGTLRAISGYFTIPLNDSSNVRYVPEFGGGALFDLGCYQILLARMLFGEEPRRAIGATDQNMADQNQGVDRLTSLLLDFPSGHASFTCGFELTWSQRITLIGTKARIEVDVPTAAPASRPTRLYLDPGLDPFAESALIEEFPACDQYALEADEFSRAILEDLPVSTPLEDSRKNLLVIEAVLRSIHSGRWEPIAFPFEPVL